MRIKTVGTIVVSGMLFVGCGGETKAAEAPKPADQPAAAPAAPTTPTSVSVPGGGTASVGQLPADFPKDVPVYAGATVVSSSTTGGMAAAVLNTADASEKVADFYKAELEKNGWTDAKSMSVAGTNTVTAKKEKRMASVAITKDAQGKTNISIGVTTMP